MQVFRHICLNFKHVNFDTYVYVYRCLIQNMNENDTICILHMFFTRTGSVLRDQTRICKER